MILNDETTWPEEVVHYLLQHHKLFLDWERRGTETIPTSVARANTQRWEDAIHELRAVLNAHALHGYHCTRLTESEIDHVASCGMQLPDRAVLLKRIERIQKVGLIESHVAERLMQQNQAGDYNRAGMVCFCFFPPHLDSQAGIERFFRSWGGEALYNSHEKDPVTGPALEGLEHRALSKPMYPSRPFPVLPFFRFTYIDSS